MTFWFSIISILHLYLYCTLWCDISSPTARVTWYSGFSRPLKYLFIRYCASFSLSSHHPHPQCRRTCLSTVCELLADTDIHSTYVSRMELSLAARFPSASSTMYAQRDLVFVRWQVSGLHGERNSSHRENGTVATRIAPRSFAPDKALPSLPSCLSTLLAVACCRFTSPFCKCANIALALV